jgi:hypothetical protein
VQCIGKLTVLNKQDEGRQAMEQALRLRTKDAFLEYHAGVSLSRRAMQIRPKRILQRALSINPHFHAILRAHTDATLQILEGRPGTDSHSGEH